MERGHTHPLTLVIRDLNAVFTDLGFSIALGPELESEDFNFDYLNIPKDHPARDMQDTFYVEGKPGHVLRTHTSPVQIRYMKSKTKEGIEPPYRIIVPGKVFRNEATDATHEAQFYQIEGLMVGKDVSLGTLKGVLGEVFSRFFGGDVEVRFRPSFFAFVEPGVEVDMRLTGADVPEKLRGRWIEVMGAGMVHPRVLAWGGVNPRKFQGFAFGGGVDRLAMLRYGVDDIRLFYSGDLRVINQF